MIFNSLLDWTVPEFLFHQKKLSEVVLTRNISAKPFTSIIGVFCMEKLTNRVNHPIHKSIHFLRMKMKDRHSTLQQATREGPLLCRFSLASQLWYLASRVPFRCQEGFFTRGLGCCLPNGKSQKTFLREVGPS